MSRLNTYQFSAIDRAEQIVVVTRKGKTEKEARAKLKNSRVIKLRSLILEGVS